MTDRDPNRGTLEEDVKVLSGIFFVAGALVLFLGLIGTLSHGHPMGAVAVCGVALFLWATAYALLAVAGMER